jgi:hypothetical protein
MSTPDSPAYLQRPIKRLKGFKRVTIPAGQVKAVAINIDCFDLWFWDDKNDRITFDQGKYVFEIGTSSKDIRGTVEAIMSGRYTPALKTVVAECGKVLLKQGNTVQTSVTAAMSDDSFYDIKKAKVTYKSNNPAVAVVDGNGLVTAKGAGVASIFASVSIDGKNISDSYPVKVIPDLTLASIEVNGKKVAGFNPEIRGYSYLAEAGSRAPLITVAQAGNNVTVDILQAETIPGTAIITLSDNTTVEKSEYAVSFGTKSIGDEFKKATIGKQWSWVREDPDNWTLMKSPGALVITAQKGDIQTTSNNAENILLQSANSDWIINSKIVFSERLTKANQQGGILAYQDDDNYVKLVYNNARKGFMGSEEYIELIVEKHGSQVSAANIKIGELLKNKIEINFKLVKKGSTYTAYYSTNGKGFEFLGSTESILSNVQAGLIACNGNDIDMRSDLMAQMMMQMDKKDEQNFEVKVDYFRIKSIGMK